MISIGTICDWADTNPRKRNFVEGERVFNANHIIKFGKNKSESEASNSVKVSAYCLQTSDLKSDPHEINGEVTFSGNIISMTCTCKAGLGERCKHIIATLLYCNRNNIDQVEELSCTDKKCAWKKCFKEALKNYNPEPLRNHNCYKTEEKTKDFHLTKTDIEDIDKLVIKNLPFSSHTINELGRHGPIKKVYPASASKSIDRSALQAIFNHQLSQLMNTIAHVQVNITVQQCCLEKMYKLFVDVIAVCERTLFSYHEWLQERRYRITGTTCYNLFTYIKNKNPDWVKKCQSLFDVSDFKSQYTEYGKKTENEALAIFIKKTGLTVLKTGLIISQQNPWLAFSPDGIIFENEKPCTLLEIKCPFKGKSMNINEAISQEFGKCLVFSDEGVSLKKKHKYYGQVQLGMAILNVKKTYFFIYASYDQSYVQLEISFDEKFVIEMLSSLKRLYISTIVHQICLHNDDKENDNTKKNSEE